MRFLRPLAILLLTLACTAAACADDWKPAAGPLMTRWAKDVSPTNALPEYPRPQMVRADWQNLNGLWDYAIQPSDTAVPQTYQGKILVPYPVESALSGVMKRVSEKQRLWYHRTFQVPEGWKGRRVLLHFGAVDWEACVVLNGKELGNHRGGYDAFTFDITDALAPSGDQHLVVSVFDATNSGPQARGKQVHNPGGIMYTPTTGIWQTVWLEPVAQSHIRSIEIMPDVDAGMVEVKTNVGGADSKALVQVTVLDAGRVVVEGKAAQNEKLRLAIPNAKLWSPDQPFLYDLKVQYLNDTVQSYFGMRKIDLGKDEQGVLRMRLNGKFVFQAGPLDQGFWPDGLYTAATDEALRYDIEITRKLGFNAMRKHVKVEPDRWYYWCDKLGLLVWQDMPAGDVQRTPESKKQFELELQRMIEGLRNHPSIIMWVVFNEGWGQHDTPRYVAEVKKLDPSRLVNNASGWTDQRCGDVIDMHNYPGPGSPKPETARAAVLGEFGGLGLAVPEHMWTQKHWGYAGTANFDDLTKKYCKLLARAWTLKDKPGLCAAIYTQITDVETECNGLLTYDRAVVKVDLAKAAAANQGQLQLSTPKTIVPTSQKEGIVWRYTIEKPADGWFKPELDDSAWKEGKGGFGTKDTPGAVVGTEWKTADIWLRRAVELPAVNPDKLALTLHHDEDAKVYINGVLAAKAGGFSGDYDTTPILPEARKAIKQGKNIIAVHCHQTSGGQFIDVGIVEE